MVKVSDTVVKVKLYESEGEELCVSFGSLLQCSTQIIVYAENTVLRLSKRPRSNLRVYLNIDTKNRRAVLNKDSI